MFPKQSWKLYLEHWEFWVNLGKNYRGILCIILATFLKVWNLILIKIYASSKSLFQRKATTFFLYVIYINWTSERFRDFYSPNWSDVVEVESGYLEFGMDFGKLRYGGQTGVWGSIWNFQRQIPLSLKFSVSPHLKMQHFSLNFRMSVHLLCFITLVIKDLYCTLFIQN